MMRLLGSAKRLCNGLTRRDLLHVGGLGLFGLGLGDFFSLKRAQASTLESSPGFGRAKRCILLYLYGSPAQHETFDPKPQAPPEVRGEMGAIQSSLSGVNIGEGLPKTAQLLDRTTIVRSMVHPYPLHGTVYAMSGIPNVDTKIEAKPRHPRQWPFIGSVVDYLAERNGEPTPNVPRNIALPYLLHSKANYFPLAGPYGTFLGTKYDPVWTEFNARGIKVVPNLGGESGSSEHFYDPNGEIDPRERLTISATKFRDGVTPRRLEDRRSLLRQFEQTRALIDRSPRAESYDSQQQLAYSLLTSNNVRTALDVQSEPDRVRQAYGMTLFGQATLAARRLIEAGGRFVTVFWDSWKYNNGSWDTHEYHYPRLKKVLLPGFDAAYSSLIHDLEQRGLLDDTLVLCFSEHGRTPKLNNRPGGGRDHWSRAYSAIFAGGGIAAGRVVGSTDDIAGDVVSTPLSPKDILATAFHQLGIAPDTTVPDRLGRPVPITGTGKLRRELLS